MDSTTEYLGFAAIFGGFIAGRFVSEGALRKLTTEQKAAVVDAFADFRRYPLIVLAAIVLSTMAYPWLGLMGVATYFVVAALLTYRRLQQSNLPGEYVRAQMVGTSLSLLGLGVAMGAWWWPSM
jgi:hypothetical protein